MNNCLQLQKALIIFPALLITTSSYSQQEPVFRKSNFGIEIIASVLPPATITRDQGNYRLRSHLQSAYDLGVNYLYNINKQLVVSSGVHIVVGKRNFFLRTQKYDAPLIEEKTLWGAVRIPLLVEKKFTVKKTVPVSVKAGLNLRYSGFLLDESSGHYTLDSNNQVIELFNTELSARNGGKPWITFTAGLIKPFILPNHNLLSVGLQADISTRYFYKGYYRITFPGQPVTSGLYKLSGTSLGLSAQYIFTGANKNWVRRAPAGKRQKNNNTIREDLQTGLVFKGNHLQFDVTLLSTFKARLNKASGEHPIKTTGTPGMLISFKYRVNFNNKNSLVLGPEAIIAGRNLVTSFKKNDFSPPLVADYKINPNDLYVPDLILALPVMLEKRKLYARTKYFYGNAGARINFSTGADFDISSIYLMRVDSSFYNAGGWDVNANNDIRPWISLPLSAGHGWLLKNNNLLQLAFSLNISFTRYVEGVYQITVPGKPPSLGSYSSTGSYMGLSFQYIFTNANYRIRKTGQKTQINF